MIPIRIAILLLATLAAMAQPAPGPAPLAPLPPAPAVAPQPPQPPQPPVQPAQPFVQVNPGGAFDFDFDFNFGPAFQDRLAQIKLNTEQIVAQANQFKFDFPGRGPRGRGDDGLYNSGQRALDRGQWDEALADFNRVVSNGGTRAEGALYWKAYTLNKLGRRDEARAATAELRKTYPSSHWLDDANALDMEIQQAAGQNVSPESQPDEELKLMALNALIHSDPDRAMPLLENLLKSAQPPRVKERALFVLSQTESPRAQQILDQVARGGGNPDIQITAITYLGATARRRGNTQPLFDIYAGASDINVKRAILRALLSRMTPMSPSAAGGDTDRMLQLIRTEKNAELRAEGIRLLSSKTDTGDALAGMWANEQDPQVKHAILDALSGQRNAKALVDIARKERDPQMKKEIVGRLSGIQSKEATDYLMELLK